MEIVKTPKSKPEKLFSGYPPITAVSFSRYNVLQDGLPRSAQYNEDPVVVTACDFLFFGSPVCRILLSSRHISRQPAQLDTMFVKNLHKDINSAPENLHLGNIGWKRTRICS